MSAVACAGEGETMSIRQDAFEVERSTLSVSMSVCWVAIEIIQAD
jgi:hypothetical protein